MRQIRIYQPGDYQPGTRLQLSPEAGQHVGVVLRMSEGEPLTLFSGDNVEYEALIVSVHKKKVDVEILSAVDLSRESPLQIDLGQGLSKGERMDWVIQKAVELGVYSITPLVTRHCAVRLDAARMEKRLAQWRSMVVAACEQCGRNRVPLIRPLTVFQEYLNQSPFPNKLILDPEASVALSRHPLQGGGLTLLVGPEGGFSNDEVLEANQAGFDSVSLGSRILRTETAAIAAISVLQAVKGDL